MVNQVKGTHDIYGLEASEYGNIELRAKLLASLYGYREIKTPVLEHTALFKRAVGSSTDIVRKEMYTFEDKAGRSLSLRPEFTAGIVRSVVNNKLYAAGELPVKLFYAGPCFRYERPQAGRYRQFGQFGVEAIGAPSVYLDAEAISLGYRIIESLGFKKIVLRLNSLGDEASRRDYEKALVAYFSAHVDRMCSDCQLRLKSNPLRILDCKDPDDRKIIQGAPKIMDYLSKESAVYLKQVELALKDLGITCETDGDLVRGLDYYSGVVWEYVVADEGAPDVGAVGGGGHYDRLVEELGGPALEGVGFSLGIERLASLSSALFAGDGLENGPDFYFIPLLQEALERYFPIVEKLRLAGLVVDMPFKVRSPGTALKAASKAKAKFAVLVGPDELARGEASVKNLRTGEQVSVPEDELLSSLAKMLEKYLDELCRKMDGKDAF